MNKKEFIIKKKTFLFIKTMNFEIFFQLFSILLISVAGPLVIVLLFSRGGNL